MFKLADLCASAALSPCWCCVCPACSSLSQGLGFCSSFPSLSGGDFDRRGSSSPSNIRSSMVENVNLFLWSLTNDQSLAVAAMPINYSN